MKKVRNALFHSLIIFFAAGAFFAVGIAVGGFAGYRLATPPIENEDIDQAEAEYYRGIYDICIQQIRMVQPCHKIVRTVTDAEWYEKPSTGWEWPLVSRDTVAKSQ